MKSETGTFRFVVCIDVDIDVEVTEKECLKNPMEALKEAYRECYLAMSKLPEGMEWESSDEAFWPDIDLDDSVRPTEHLFVHPDDLSEARMAFFNKHLNVEASIYYEAEEGAEQHLLGSCIYAYGTDPTTMEAELYSKYWNERLTAASCSPVYRFRDEE